MRDISASIIVLSGAICFGVGGIGVAFGFAMPVGLVVMTIGLLGWLGIPRNRRED